MHLKNTEIKEPEEKTKEEEKETGEIETTKEIVFKKGFLGFGKKVNSKPTKTDYNLKEPVLFVIRGNHDVDMYEGIKEGKITIERGKDEVDIALPKSKLLSINWGGTSTKAWITSEDEAIAYPINTLHDSRELKKIIGAIIMNYKNYETKKMQEWTKMLMWVVIGVIGFFFVVGIFKIPMPWDTAAQAIGNTVDQNAVKVLALIGI